MLGYLPAYSSSYEGVCPDGSVDGPGGCGAGWIASAICGGPYTISFDTTCVGSICISACLSPSSTSAGSSLSWSLCNSGDRDNGDHTCTHTNSGGTSYYSDPSCPSGGDFDWEWNYSNGDKCYADFNPSCPTGSTYNAGLGQCTTSPTCPSGLALDTSTGVCAATASPDCSALPGYVYDSSTSTCHTPPVCANGAYSATQKRCNATVVHNCGSYSYESSTGKCVQAVSCPTDNSFSLNSTIHFDPTLSLCVSDTQHNCPAAMSYNGLPIEMCEAVPVCGVNARYNPQTDTCVGQYTPPAGSGTCHQIAGDTTEIAPGIPAEYSSPNNCQSDTSGMDTINDTPTGQNDKTNDGQHDAAGNCLGQIYLFNGEDMRCRLFDDTGMTTSIAELVAEIALMATGVGEAMFATEFAFDATVAMEGTLETIGMSAEMATTVAQGVMEAAISTTLTTAANTAISATINGNLNGVGAGLSQGAMSFGMSVAGSLLSGMASGALSGIKDYMGLSNGGGQNLIGQTTTISDATGVTTFTQTAADGASSVSQLESNLAQSGTPLSEFTAGKTFTTPDGSTYTDYTTKGVEIDGKTTGASAMLAVDGKTGLVTWNAYKTVRETSASALLLNQLQDIAGKYGNQVAQIASQSMLSQYTPLKCCYPDKLGACESSEIQEANEQANGMCHVIGSYCSKKFLFVCMAEKQTSCCFQSQLARIMHEQGRPQLQSFSSGWGTAQNPICRGFTPEEFQALNFSIMDLSEWEASLNANLNEIAPLVSQFINSVGNSAAPSIQSSPAYRGAQ